MAEALKAISRLISTLLPHKQIGLKPKEHGLLNKQANSYPRGIEAKRKKIEELRKKYRKKKNFTALEEIDFYDPDDNEPFSRFKKYRDALDRGDEKEALEIYFDEAVRRKFGGPK